jgi:hypothetical protein
VFSDGVRMVHFTNGRAIDTYPLDPCDLERGFRGHVENLRRAVAAADMRRQELHATVDRVFPKAFGYVLK